MMGCKGICIRYKADRPKSGIRYMSGQKRCQICEIYLNWQGLWCPCCRCRLRGRPKKRAKTNFGSLEQKKGKNIQNLRRF
jgi:hypothetical protein